MPSTTQRGLTLIELIVFIVIVSTALASVLAVLNITTRNSADPMINKQMLVIAESLLEEVQLKDFDDTVASRSGTACYAGAFDQANRTNFDCVKNYDGFPFGTTGIFQSDGVTATPGLGAYTASVTVAHPTAAVDGVAATAVWVITVTVVNGTNNLTLTGYRFNYG